MSVLGNSVLVRAKVLEPNGHVHHTSLFPLNLDQTLFEQIETLQIACSIDGEMDEYEIGMADRDLPIHTRVRQLQLRSGDCIVLHHLRDSNDLKAPAVPAVDDYHYASLSATHAMDDEDEALLRELQISQSQRLLGVNASSPPLSAKLQPVIASSHSLAGLLTLADEEEELLRQIEQQQSHRSTASTASSQYSASNVGAGSGQPYAARSSSLQAPLYISSSATALPRQASAISVHSHNSGAGLSASSSAHSFRPLSTASAIDPSSSSSSASSSALIRSPRATRTHTIHGFADNEAGHRSHRGEATFSGLKIRDADAAPMSARSIAMLSARPTGAVSLSQQFRQEIGAEKWAQIGFGSSSSTMAPANPDAWLMTPSPSELFDESEVAAMQAGKMELQTPQQRLSSLIARTIVDEYITVSVHASEERRILEEVGGCLHALIEQVDLRVQTPKTQALFDRQHATLRDSWDECAADLTHRLRAVLDEPVFIGPSLLRDTSVSIGTKHEISDFMERLTFSADLPASLNPAMHISNLIVVEPPAAPSGPGPESPRINRKISTVSFNPSVSTASLGKSSSATASGFAPTATSASSSSSASSSAPAGETKQARALRHGQAIRDCLHAHSQTVSFLCDLASNLIDLQEVHETALMVEQLSSTLPGALLALSAASVDLASSSASSNQLPGLDVHFENDPQAEFAAYESAYSGMPDSPVAAHRSQHSAKHASFAPLAPSNAHLDDQYDSSSSKVMSPRRIASSSLNKRALKDERDAANQSYSLEKISPKTAAKLSARGGPPSASSQSNGNHQNPKNRSGALSARNNNSNNPSSRSSSNSNHHHVNFAKPQTSPPSSSSSSQSFATINDLYANQNQNFPDVATPAPSSVHSSTAQFNPFGDDSFRQHEHHQFVQPQYQNQQQPPMMNHMRFSQYPPEPSQLQYNQVYQQHPYHQQQQQQQSQCGPEFDHQDPDAESHPYPQQHQRVPRLNLPLSPAGASSESPLHTGSSSSSSSSSAYAPSEYMPQNTNRYDDSSFASSPSSSSVMNSSQAISDLSPINHYQQHPQYQMQHLPSFRAQQPSLPTVNEHDEHPSQQQQPMRPQNQLASPQHHQPSFASVDLSLDEDDETNQDELLMQQQQQQQAQAYPQYPHGLQVHPSARHQLMASMLSGNHQNAQLLNRPPSAWSSASDSQFDPNDDDDLVSSPSHSEMASSRNAMMLMDDSQQQQQVHHSAGHPSHPFQHGPGPHYRGLGSGPGGSASPSSSSFFSDPLDSPYSTVASARDRPQPKRPAAVPPLPLGRVLMAQQQQQQQQPAFQPQQQLPPPQHQQQLQQVPMTQSQQVQQQLMMAQQQQPQQQKPAPKPQQQQNRPRLSGNSSNSNSSKDLSMRPGAGAKALPPNGSNSGNSSTNGSKAVSRSSSQASGVAASTSSSSSTASSVAMSNSNSRSMLNGNNNNNSTTSTTSLASQASHQSAANTPSSSSSGVKYSLSTAKRMEQPLRSTDVGMSALANLHKLQKMQSMRKQASQSSMTSVHHASNLSGQNGADHVSPTSAASASNSISP